MSAWLRNGEFVLSILELIAAGTGILSVWFSSKRNILVYPVGLTSVLLYVYLCFSFGIYADMVLNIFYAGMSVYGWYRWRCSIGNDQTVAISSLKTQARVFTCLASGALWFLIYLWLSRITDSTVPIIDSFTSALSVVAMVLMAERKIEHWYFWIIVNVASIPLYLHKELHASAVQFAVFTVLAVYGLWSWRRELRSLSSLNQK